MMIASDNTVWRFTLPFPIRTPHPFISQVRPSFLLIVVLDTVLAVQSVGMSQEKPASI